MSCYRKYPIIIAFSLFFFLTDLLGQQMQMCEYQRPRVIWSVLPVFPSNPLKEGEKCNLVFDVMLNKEGQPILANPLNAPNSSFTKAFTCILPLRTYNPATECEVPVYSVYRDIVYSYLYVNKVEVEGELTDLPVSRWAIDSEVARAGVFWDEPIKVRLNIDKNGILTKAVAIDKSARKLVDGLCSSKIGKKLFIPAKINNIPVGCELIQVFGNDTLLPVELLEGLDTHSESLSASLLDDARELMVKINYGSYGYMSSIIMQDTDSISPKELWRITDGMRYWKKYGRDMRKEQLVVLGVVPGDPSIVLDRKDIEFIAPVPTKRYPPSCPPYLMKKGIRGKVVVDAIIDETGKPMEVKVYKSSNKAFSSRAMAAVKKWHFKPAAYDGRPVKVVVRIPINFNLQ